MPNTHAHAAPADEFFTEITRIAQLVRTHWDRMALIDSAFGVLGVQFVSAENSEESEFGDYAVVGFTLPAGVYAEIEDSTYGVLQGLRIYRDGE